MNLQIGLLKPDPTWQILLMQTGIPYRLVEHPAALKAQEMAVLAVNSAEPGFAEPIRRYLQSGGSVLTEADTARQLLGGQTATRKIRYLTAGNDSIFRNFSICDLPGRREIARSAQYLPDQSGAATTAVQDFGEGCAVIFPSGFCAAKAVHAVCRRSFPGEPGLRNPSERVCCVDKGGQRRLWLQALQFLFQRRGLPLVRLWPFPAGAPSLFGFRIDTDFASPEALQALYEQCREHDIPATWFVETQSAADRMHVFAEMRGQEIAYHCYRHRLFSRREKLTSDFLQGLEILEKAGLTPRGYAAPFGEWTPLLGEVLEQYGFAYSSEFAQGYDDAPFPPVVSDRLSSVWQVPVHPVSAGRLRWARHDTGKIQDYFRRVWREKLARFEPAIIYHHPAQAPPHLFQPLFREVHRNNVPVLSLGAFARWSRHRADCRWSAHYTAGGVTIEVQQGGKDVWLAVDWQPESSQLFPLKNQRIAAKTAGKTMTERQVPPCDAASLRQITAQMVVHEITWHYSKCKQ